jgi:hypothetical protein
LADELRDIPRVPFGHRLTLVPRYRGSDEYDLFEICMTMEMNEPVIENSSLSSYLDGVIGLRPEGRRD